MLEAVGREQITPLEIGKVLKTRPGDLVMPDPFGLLFSKILYYFRPYKNQVEPGYKGHTIAFMVDVFLEHLGPFGTIEDHLRPY